MKNIAYSLFFTLWTAQPSTQITTVTGRTSTDTDIEVSKIIQHKKDSVYNEIDSLRYDVQEIKTKQKRIDNLRSLEQKLDKKLQNLKDENQYKRITKEFDF